MHSDLKIYIAPDITGTYHSHAYDGNEFMQCNGTSDDLDFLLCLASLALELGVASEIHAYKHDKTVLFNCISQMEEVH